MNGDGFDDLIVGAYRASGYAGESYVVFGHSTPFASSLALLGLDGTTGFRLDGIDAFDQSGWSVASAGDVNGDGFDDLIVGAYGANRARGESYVVFGRSTPFASSLALLGLDGTTGFRLDGIDAFDRSGFSVASAGDVNGDGFDDLIVGASGGDRGSYVVFGHGTPFASSLALSSLDGSMGFRLAGGGYSVASARDVNGDGFDDVIVGAEGGAGSTYVVFGHASTGAADDDFAVAENGTVAADLFADNGHGIDSVSPGNSLTITRVNGSAANVGVEFALASGALITVLADGSFSYDTNGVFDDLPAPGSGASNATVNDTFTYRLADSTTATVTVTVSGLDTDDRLNSTSGADTLFAGIGEDQVFGLGGNDTLGGGLGNDSLAGGTQFDTADWSTATGNISFALDASGSGVTSNVAGIGVDSLSSIENLISGSGSDSLAGNGFANTLSGMGGDDTLSGGGGSDTLKGGIGNDKFKGGTGNDSLAGGTQSDTADWSTATGNISFALDASGSGVTSNVAGIGVDSLSSIENLISGSGNDSLAGNGLANALSGMGGDDTLSGGGGGDILNAGIGNDVIAGGIGHDTIEGGVGSDTLFGTAGDDSLLGGAGGDRLIGDPGDDTVSGEAGNDTFRGGPGADEFHGGDGLDIVIYWPAAPGMVIDRANPLNNTGDAAGDSYEGIERLFLSRFDDVYRGDAQRDVVSGRGGDDDLMGRGGGDGLVGAEGNDTLTGGAGGDILVGGTGADRFVFLEDSDSEVGSIDTVGDFSHTDGDLIDLSAVFGGTLSFRGDDPFTGAAAEVRAIVVNALQAVLVDLNADQQADMRILVLNPTQLVEEDFVL